VDEQRLKKVEFLYTLALNGYNHIIETSRQLDQKTHNIIALTSVLLPVLLGLFSYVFGEAASQLGLFPWVAFCVAIGILMFIIAIAKGCWTYRTHTFKALDPYTFAKNHVKESLLDLVEVAVSTLGDMTDHNWKVNEQKAASYEGTLRYLTLGAIAFGIGFLLLMFALAYPNVRLG